MLPPTPTPTSCRSGADVQGIYVIAARDLKGGTHRFHLPMDGLNHTAAAQMVREQMQIEGKPAAVILVGIPGGKSPPAPPIAA